jgi:hypothetical protein
MDMCAIKVYYIIIIIIIISLHSSSWWPTVDGGRVGAVSCLYTSRGSLFQCLWKETGIWVFRNSGL